MEIKKRHLFSLSLALSLCAVLIVFGLIKIKIRGQESPEKTMLENSAPGKSEPEKTAPLKPESEKLKSFAAQPSAVSSVNFDASAAENARLENEIAWTFGAKSQRGWRIYVSLIQHTIETEDAHGTAEFARAVSEWQQKSGLLPSGVIDNETLLKMVEWWQSRRLKSSKYLSADELLSAPVEDFYDPSRPPELRQVERETYAAYKKMVAAAAKDLKLKTEKNGELAPEEKFLRIISAFRSREYQEKLRRASPDSGRAGLAVNSPHFTGRALDIYVGGEPTITKDPNRVEQVQTPAYKWLVKNAERFGFRPYYYEPWHWEYVR